MSNPKTAKDILIEAKSLIAEKGWAQGYFAYDKSKVRISPWKEDAACFCTIGAVIRVCSAFRFAIFRDEKFDKLSAIEKQELYESFIKENEKAKIALVQAVNVYHIPTWNDDPTRTKQDVLDAFDKAIESV